MKISKMFARQKKIEELHAGIETKEELIKAGLFTGLNDADPSIDPREAFSLLLQSETFELKKTEEGFECVIHYLDGCDHYHRIYDADLCMAVCKSALMNKVV